MSADTNEPNPNDLAQPVFVCRRCGQCCTGEGGIVLSPFDSERLAAHLGLSPQDFTQRHVVQRGGKPRLACGPDGNCAFFTAGRGCSVHSAKPDVCRAWPFFRGNLVDEYSLALAREYCPGLVKDAPFAEFVRQGMEYLRVNGLKASPGGPNALVWPERPAAERLGGPSSDRVVSAKPDPGSKKT